MSQNAAGYFGLKRESTWGSGGAATVFFELLSENLTLNKDRFDYKNIIGTLAQPDDLAGVNRVAGGIVVAANPANIGYLLMSTFNTVTTTSLTAALWKHIYKQPTNSNSAFSTACPTVPYTAEIFRDVTTATQYTGLVANNISFNFTPNQDVRVTADFIGRGTSPVSAQVATFPNSPLTPFTFDQCSVSLGGSATARIENLTVSVNNNFEGIPSLNNSKDIAKIKRTGPQMVSISGTIDYEDQTEYNDFVNQTERQLIVTATMGASFQMILNMPRIVYTAFPLGQGGRGRNIVSFTGKAFYHTGSATGIAVTLTTINSYH